MAQFIQLEKALLFEQRSATGASLEPGRRAAHIKAARRDKFLEQVEWEPYHLKGLLSTLRKQGPLRWSHKPGFCLIEADRYWVKIIDQQGQRIWSNISLGGK